ncbi:MAG: 3-isopropylmalate dehydratase small subunit [Methanobacteriota archaeon]|nr:MAG: 3-isopropylmalate dehydratase small subunit [Euryarchaeota archaeon]TLZ86634.1 MAG: 3-isopropylmalate dehydratase small subunit [Euryarchaeota archaeon]
MQTRFEGRVWTFGDDISTDHIIAGKYLGTTDPKVFAEHAFESVDPTWAKKVQRGDMIVAGANFGCGSSREQAPVALKTLGISAILANSFARIFFRNAINLGFPVVECAGLRDRVKTGDTIELDLAEGEVRIPSGQTLKFTPLPANVLEILEAGGLVPKLRKELHTESTA